MVKGISRQVIVVHSPDPKLFEQAIFILKEDAVEKHGVTEEALMKEAKGLINLPDRKTALTRRLYGPVWGFAGASVTALVWLILALL